MPRYIQSNASQELPTPFHFPAVKAWVLMFEIAMGPVKRYCDTFLNLGDPRRRPFVYRPMPLHPFATMMVLEYPVMVSGDRNSDLNPTFAQRGFMSQREVLIDFPVIRHGARLENFLTDLSMEFAVPFIIVDNPTSAVSGREIIGFQKIVGEIDIETIQGESPIGGQSHVTGFRTGVRMRGHQRADETDLESLLKLMEITIGPPTPEVGRHDNRASPMTLLDTRFARKGLEGVAALGDLMNRLALGTMPSLQQMVALKQFRDPSRFDHAIYQAITTASPRYYNIRDLQYYNEADASIVMYAGGSRTEIVQSLFERDDAHTPNVRWGEERNGATPVTIRPCLVCSFTSEIDYAEQSTLYTYVSPEDPGGERPHGDMVSPWLKPWKGFWARR
jgi:hypothetical protein